MKLIDLTGQTFGRLHVVAMAHTSAGKKRLWRCQCACGTEKLVQAGNLRSGNTQSCGCVPRVAPSRHRPPAYQSWRAAKSRCFDPKNNRYHNYGARGITMCDRWRDSFAAFVADMGPRPEGMTLDRIDPNGNYEPGNCRWATPKEQRANQR